MRAAFAEVVFVSSDSSVTHLCEWCGQAFPTKRGASTHERWCWKNPHADLRRESIKQSTLQSSYGSTTAYGNELYPSHTEAAFAELLDLWDVEYNRYPDPLPYTDDSGETHYYHPDFVATEKDALYYEPGQLSAAKSEKLSRVTDQNDVTVSVYTPRQIFTILNKERGGDDG